MIKTKIVIAEQFYIGFSNRSDGSVWDDEKQKYVALPPVNLGFATYFEDNAAFRKRKETVDSWSDKKLTTQTIDNVPARGFRLSRNVTHGGGIAKAIKTRYPGAAAVDAETTRGDVMKLGNWTVYNQNDQFVIVNAYTQYNMSNGEDVFEYDAFKLILQKLYFLTPEADFGFPLIGMGLARGDVRTIYGMIEEFADKVEKSGGSVTVVTLP